MPRHLDCTKLGEWKDGNNIQDSEVAYITSNGKRKTMVLKCMPIPMKMVLLRRWPYVGNAHDSKEFDELLDIKKTKNLWIGVCW
jgi:hypothetical protein